MAMPFKKELGFFIAISFFFHTHQKEKDRKKHIYNHKTKPPKINLWFNVEIRHSPNLSLIPLSLPKFQTLLFLTWTITTASPSAALPGMLLINPT